MLDWIHTSRAGGYEVAVTSHDPRGGPHVVCSPHQELIVLDGLDSPRGKWAPLLGNVVVMESSYAAQLLQQVGDTVLALLETLGTSALPGVTVPAAGATLPGLVPLREFVDSLDAETLAQYAMQVHIQASEPFRSDMYFQDTAGVKVSMLEFTNRVAMNLGLGYPAAVSAPLANALQGTQFLQLFLNQVRCLWLVACGLWLVACGLCFFFVLFLV